MVSIAKRTGRYSLRKKPLNLTPFTRVSDDAQLTWLEKGGQTGGATTQEQIEDALEEYVRLFKAGIASNAEKLTLARAFPDAPAYTSAIKGISPESVMVVGGPASIEMVDREGHLIKAEALDRAFKKYMENFRTRNAMVLHSDVQVGWALPAYITKGGQIFKSGVNGKELFFICELRDDTRIAERVSKQIEEGKLRSYSIAGSATKVQNVQKGVTPYMQVDDMELAEVTVCEKGVNQGAAFQILKAQTGKISKDQCGYRPATDVEIKNSIMCGTCKYYNKDDKTCDTVDGIFEDTDYCKLFEAEEEEQPEKQTAIVATPPKIKVRLILSDNGQNIDFNKTLQELVQNPEWSTTGSGMQTQRDFWDFTKEDEPMSITKRLLNLYKQGGNIGFDTPSKVSPSKGKGAAAMGGAVNPAMGNPEIQLAGDYDEEEMADDPKGYAQSDEGIRSLQDAAERYKQDKQEEADSKYEDAPVEKGIVDRLRGAYKGLRGQPRSNEPDYNPAYDPEVQERQRQATNQAFWDKPDNRAMGQAISNFDPKTGLPFKTPPPIEDHTKVTDEQMKHEMREIRSKGGKGMVGAKQNDDGTWDLSGAAHYGDQGSMSGEQGDPTKVTQEQMRNMPHMEGAIGVKQNPDGTFDISGAASPAPPPKKDFGSVQGIKDMNAQTRRNMGQENPDRGMNKSLVKRLSALYKANSDPMTTGEAFTTLENTEARVKEHEQLLREYGFPNEVGAEANRYLPVVETETDDKGVPINMKGPWVVNEAGNDVGELLDEDAPSFSASEKAQNREGKKTASVSKSYLIKPPVIPFLSKRSL